MIYCGIGSRTAPQHIWQWCCYYGSVLAEKGFTLRSGGAPGCDSAFEAGCDSKQGKKQIFLPWKNFNNNKSPLFSPSKEALEIAKKFHPKWDALHPNAYNLMARNTHQVLGKDLNTPADFIICWTKEGKEQGGTAQAIRIARNFKIPVFNLENDLSKLDNFLNSVKLIDEFIAF